MFFKITITIIIIIMKPVTFCACAIVHGYLWLSLDICTKKKPEIICKYMHKKSPKYVKYMHFMIQSLKKKNNIEEKSRIEKKFFDQNRIVNKKITKYFQIFSCSVCIIM